MAYKTVFRYLGLYEKSYRSYTPNINELSSFKDIINIYSNTTNQTEEDVVSHIDTLLKFLNYSDFIKHDAQTQHRQSSHADIEIVQNTTQVIIEVKKPSNINEMPSPESILSKALYECIWYYFNRKDSVETYEIKHLVITNGIDYYFIKPASIAQLSQIEKLCYKYKNNKLSLPNTAKLYRSIEKILKDNDYENKIVWTHISIQDNLEYLYKLLHRNFLLREFVASDNNLLNNSFYKGLLDIIGLEQNDKSLLVQAKSKNSLVYGIMQSDIEFDDALRLASTWINRLLFLKLFEQQLISFNNDDNSYSFLNRLKRFSDYHHLFFNVLGTEYNSRNTYVSSYSKVPFLNSSLFEQIDLEYKCSISFLDSLDLNIGSIPLSEYIIQFLNKYNFVSNISTENTDINPSVLGLIFEKINGYSDGAVFTPAYITEYMTKETIDKLVINRVNQYFVSKGKEPCNDIDEIKFLLDSCIHIKEDKAKINEIFDTLRICDPAVGSGHFLVSALNYILYLKFYLGLISIPNITLDIQNDCLIVYEFKNNDYKQFKYNRNNQDSLNTQKALFTEKSKIIRKNLFGVDINPTSVNICKLRLWIELLKNCYYINQTDMEILPNLDINVLCGNSLISSFKYKTGLPPSIDFVNIYGGVSTSIYMYNPEQLNKDLLDYRTLVDKFWNARTKDYKKDIRKQINKIKDKLNPYDLINKDNYERNLIFSNGINWGIDFPEVVESKTGVFLGFDAVITNPPYIRIQNLSNEEKDYYEEHYQVAKGSYELANLFVELASKIVNDKSNTCFIMPHKFMNTANGFTLRKSLENGSLDSFTVSKLVHFGANQIFNDVTTYTCIISFDKLNNKSLKYNKIPFIKSSGSYDNKVKQITTKMYDISSFSSISIDDLTNAYKLYGNNENNWILFNSNLEYKIFEKIMNADNPTIKDIAYKFMQGIATSLDDLYFLEMTHDNGKSFDFKLNYPKSNSTQLTDIEKRYFKKVYRGKDVQRYKKLQTNRYVFFPYDLDKTQSPYKATLADLSYIQINCPNTYSYIMSNKEGFEKREKGKLKGSNDFYRYIYPKNLSDFEQEKLMSMEITTCKTNFTLDTDNSYHNTKVYSLIKKSDCQYSYSYLLAILNSSLFWWFLYTTGDTLSGDARTVKTNYIFPFHLPKYDKDYDKTLTQLVEMRMTSGNEKYETLIDLFVMKSYNLDFDEVKTINSLYDDTYKGLYDNICLGMSKDELEEIVNRS